MMRAAGLLLFVALAGCRAHPDPRPPDPLQVQLSAAESDLMVLSRVRRPLVRPVILLSGWNDDPVLWRPFRRWLSRCATPDFENHVFAPDLRVAGGLLAAADRIASQFSALGEVDVVAHSIGGLIAREAAREFRGAGRLRIVRLYTLATPHTGTRWARFSELLPLHEQVADARPDSAFLRNLTADPSSSAMNLTTYWFEGDIVVERASAHALGAAHFSYLRPRGSRVHVRTLGDPRFLRDVLRNLLKTS